eukprot:Gb_27894 [translate_table: standard]
MSGVRLCICSILCTHYWLCLQPSLVPCSALCDLEDRCLPVPSLACIVSWCPALYTRRPVGHILVSLRVCILAAARFWRPPIPSLRLRHVPVPCSLHSAVYRSRSGLSSCVFWSLRPALCGSGVSQSRLCACVVSRCPPPYAWRKVGERVDPPNRGRTGGERLGEDEREGGKRAREKRDGRKWAGMNGRGPNERGVNERGRIGGGDWAIDRIKRRTNDKHFAYKRSNELKSEQTKDEWTTKQTNRRTKVIGEQAKAERRTNGKQQQSGLESPSPIQRPVVTTSS